MVTVILMSVTIKLTIAALKLALMNNMMFIGELTIPNNSNLCVISTSSQILTLVLDGMKNSLMKINTGLIGIEMMLLLWTLSTDLPTRCLYPLLLSVRFKESSARLANTCLVLCTLHDTQHGNAMVCRRVQTCRCVALLAVHTLCAHCLKQIKCVWDS